MSELPLNRPKLTAKRGRMSLAKLRGIVSRRLDELATVALARRLARELVEPVELPRSSDASMRLRFGSTPVGFARCDSCGRLVKRELLGMRMFPTDGATCYGRPMGELGPQCHGRLWTPQEV